MARNSGKSTTIVLILLGLVALVFVLAARSGRDRATVVSTTHAVRQNLSSWIPTNGKVEPITNFDSASMGANSYRELAKEVLERWRQAGGGHAG